MLCSLSQNNVARKMFLSDQYLMVWNEFRDLLRIMCFVHCHRMMLLEKCFFFCQIIS